MRALLDSEPAVRTEYVVLADSETLENVERIDGTVVALIAAFVGTTRLIDNQLLGADVNRSATTTSDGASPGWPLMKQTLFYIPLEVDGYPLFGWGILLAPVGGC